MDQDVKLDHFQALDGLLKFIPPGMVVCTFFTYQVRRGSISPLTALLPSKV